MGRGRRSEFFAVARPDATAHTLAIVTNVIYLGYALCFFGVLWELPKRLVKAPPESASGEEELKAGTTEQSDASVQQPAQAAAPATDWTHVEGEFQKNFGVKARVHPNGRVSLARGANKLDFENVDRAWEYCIKHFYQPPRGGRA